MFISNKCYEARKHDLYVGGKKKTTKTTGVNNQMSDLTRLQCHCYKYVKRNKRNHD